MRGADELRAKPHVVNAMAPGLAAKVYASGALGAAWPVCPLDPGTKAPHRMLPWRPKGEGGFKLATCNLEVIEDWWEKDPEAVVGVDLGRAGAAAADFEGLGKNYRVAETLERVLDAVRLPITLSATTPGGGWHFIYAVPGGAFVQTSIGDSDGVVIDGVEIRRHGHYIALPPAPGREWVTFAPPEPAPEWMLIPPPEVEPITKAKVDLDGAEATHEGKIRLDGVLRYMEQAPVGMRHKAAVFAAVKARRLSEAGHIRFDAAWGRIEEVFKWALRDEAGRDAEAEIADVRDWVLAARLEDDL